MNTASGCNSLCTVGYGRCRIQTTEHTFVCWKIYNLQYPIHKLHTNKKPPLISCSPDLERHLSVACLLASSMLFCERVATNSDNYLVFYIFLLKCEPYTGLEMFPLLYLELVLLKTNPLEHWQCGVIDCLVIEQV